MSNPSPLLLLFSLLLATPVAGSLIVWVRVLVAYPRSIPLFEPRLDPEFPERRLYLFFAGAFLAIAQALVLPTFKERVLAPARAAADTPAAESAMIASRRNLMYLNGSAQLMVFCVGMIVVLAQPKEERRASGFHLRHLPEQLRSGGVGFLASLLPVYLVILATLPLRSPETQHEMLKALSGESGLEIRILIGVQAIVLAPLAEEMLYRVLLQGGLVQAGHPPRLVVPLVAVFFAVSHLFPDSIPLIPLALVLGWVYQLRNSFLACVLIHMLFNAFNVMATLVAPAFE